MIVHLLRIQKKYSLQNASNLFAFLKKASLLLFRKKKLNPSLLTSISISLFCLLGFQDLSAQCTPTIVVDGGATTYCVNQNMEFTLSVPARPDSAIFTGTGITENDFTDSLATFNPFLAGPGMHTVTYVVISGSGSSCIDGETNELTFMVIDTSYAGEDSTGLVCMDGSSIDLYDLLGGRDADVGGTWNTVGGVTPSGFRGTLTGANISTLGAGMRSFTYTVAGMAPCANAMATVDLTITPIPSITGRDTAICLGQSVDLSTLLSGDTINTLEFKSDGGTFSSSGRVISPAMVGNFTYFVRDSSTITNCSDTARIIINVVAQPNITGRDTTICEGELVDLRILLTGDTSNVLEYATTFGVFSQAANPVSPAIGLNTYYVLDSSSVAMCADTAQIQIMVDDINNAITGVNQLCQGATLTLTSSPSGGITPYVDTTWISSDTDTATISADGLVTGLLAGTTNIRSVITDANGCMDTSANFLITVNELPAAGNIIGGNRVCISSTLNLDQDVSNGTPPYAVSWSSSNTSIATVDPNGVVMPNNTGSVMISYAVTDANGCMANSPNLSVNVDSLPNPTLLISPTDTTICIGDMATFTGMGGDTYEFLVNGVSQGTASATNTFSSSTLADNDIIRVVVNNSFGCQDTSDMVVMNVNPLPTAILTSNDADNVIGTGKSIVFTGSGGTMFQFSINANIVQAFSNIDTFETTSLSNMDTVIVGVQDINGCIDTASLIITVNAVPIAINDTVTIIEDTSFVDIDVQNNDTDPESDALVTSIVANAANGTASVIMGDSIRYIPNANYNGLDSVIYNVCDVFDNCDTATVIINVSPVNDDPMPMDDYITIMEDEPTTTTVNILRNDIEIDGDSVVLSILTGPVFGTGVIVPDSSISYTPAIDSNGLDVIVYELCDTFNNCGTAVLFIEVIPVNDPPIAIDDTVVVTMDTVNAVFSPLVNDIDIDDTTLVVTMVTTTANGSAMVDTTNTSVIYTPIAGFNGLDTINYTVCDTSNACDNGLIIVEVGFVNTPPIAVNDTVIGVNEDTAVSIDVLDNDSDVDGLGDTLKVVSVTIPASGGGSTIVDDTLVNYMPPLNFNGMDSLQYTVCDTSNGCSTAWIFLTVTPINDPPIAVNDTAQANKDTTSILIAVEENDSDIDGDVLSVAVIGMSTQGVTPSVLNDSVQYTPPAGFVGMDTITYKISDGAFMDTALLFIAVIAPDNVPPVANIDFDTTSSGSTISIDVQANDMDANGDNLTTSIVTGPAAGNTATVLNGDSIQYTASNIFVGLDTIVYQVCDASLTCDTAYVQIRVQNTLSVHAKVLLGGPYDRTALQMHDSLRRLNLIPLTEPYSTLPSLPGAYQFIHKNGGGGETITNPATVLADLGPNSIVDWVYLELLTASDTIPVASRSALIRRSGEIVDIDGTSPVAFESLSNGDYFLSVRHRNHLGVMTLSPMTYTAGTPVNIDFTPTFGGTPAFGTNAMDTVQTNLVLWAGDGNSDRRIIYNGIDNDRDPVFFEVINDPLNIDNNYNHISRGYMTGDYDMKGTSVNQGSGNDPDIIFFNIFLHPANTLSSTIFIISEQIRR